MITLVLNLFILLNLLMNFYQSKIWRYINENIYKKPVFELEIFWKKYWWIEKQHKKFGIWFSWFQILWVKFPSISEEEIKAELKKVKSTFWKWNNIFFQFGFINQLEEPFFENRKNIEKFLKQYDLCPSIRENMPLATVEIDLTKSEEDLYKNFSKTAKRYINKWKKLGLIFTKASDEDIEKFYKIWADIARFKWFYIYDYITYKNLLDYLEDTNNGWLYVVKDEKGQIYAGNIFIINQWLGVYLYGAANRNFQKIGPDYFLKWELFKFLKNNWVKKVDLLWISPSGYENHYLKGVTQAKKALWGKVIEYWGNYDLSLNKVGYEILKSIK